VFLYYLQVENLDKAMQILAAHPNNQRGQKHVADMLDVEPGIQDDTRLFLEDIFYLE
jgi:L-rhamnose mutarotase